MLEHKRQILFVDDDPLVINGYKRSIDEYSEEWDSSFSNSGKEALEILSRQHFDAIITDMKMPIMDGNELLEIVSHDFPGVMRFVLSGNIEESRALETARLAHQLIGKPCDIHKLHEIIENSFRLGDMLSNPLLVKQITGLRKIPSLPSLYLRLTKELQSENPDPRIIGDIISQDVAMTAKILQLVNSAFFGLPNEIVNAQRAVTILGTNTIKALVLSSHVFSEYALYTIPGFSIEELWHHSLIVGNLSKVIAGAAGMDLKAQGEAQLAGMLHDIGKLLMLDIPGYSMPEKKMGMINQLEFEYKILGASHAELGAYLLGLWGLPQHVVEAVAFHHFPERVYTGRFGIVSALHIANGLFHKETSKDSEKGYEEFLNTQYINQLQVTQSLNGWSMLTRNLIHNTGIQ